MCIVPVCCPFPQASDSELASLPRWHKSWIRQCPISLPDRLDLSVQVERFTLTAYARMPRAFTADFGVRRGIAVSFNAVVVETSDSLDILFRLAFACEK